MTLALTAFVAFLVANVAAGLWRIVRGPTAADRLLAPQLFGTTGVAILLAGAEVLATPALRDVALIMALLAVVTTTAFALRLWGPGSAGAPGVAARRPGDGP